MKAPDARSRPLPAGISTSQRDYRNSGACLSRPAGLHPHGDKLRRRRANGGDRTEEAPLPLPNRIGDVLQLSTQVDLADHGLECMALQIRGDRLFIDRTGAFEGLRENFAI